LKLQQEASKVKKELENTFIESEVNWLVVTVNWEMKVEKTEFENTTLIPWLNAEQKAALEKAITEAVNKWVKKSQEVAAEKMQWVMSQMWMGDMFKGGMPGLN
jgi:DNA-binding protein YbaB